MVSCKSKIHFEEVNSMESEFS